MGNKMLAAVLTLGVSGGQAVAAVTLLKGTKVKSVSEPLE
jgi:hypothetical protein